MNSTNDLIAKKVVNALIPDAEPKSFPLSPLRLVLGAFKAFQKGLWVGGTLYLTPSSIEFRPNVLNRSLHKGDTSRVVLLSDVVDVRDRLVYYPNSRCHMSQWAAPNLPLLRCQAVCRTDQGSNCSLLSVSQKTFCETTATVGY